MKRTLLCLILSGGTLLLADGDGATAQIERGRQIFLHSKKGVTCATCHSLEGQGVAVGPDITKLASVVGPRGLVTTIHMTATAYVQEYKLPNGRTFPGIEKAKTAETWDIYDLSKIPAVLVRLKPSDPVTVKTSSDWCHPPTATPYTSEEMADLVAYLKFAATGKAKEIAVSELY